MVISFICVAAGVGGTVAEVGVDVGEGVASTPPQEPRTRSIPSNVATSEDLFRYFLLLEPKKSGLPERVLQLAPVSDDNGSQGAVSNWTPSSFSTEVIVAF